MTNLEEYEIDPRRPFFAEFCGDATHLGKTTISNRFRDYLEDLGLATKMVRFESERVTSSMRDGDLLIPTELIATAEQLPGGVVGVLRPFFAEIESTCADGRAVILFDWAGGLGNHRLKSYVGSGFDRWRAKKGVDGLSFVLTTNNIERIGEAEKILVRTKQAAPGLKRVLVRNASVGTFNFPPKSASAEALKALMVAHAPCPVLNVPKIEANAWSHLQRAGVEMKAALAADPGELAERIGSDELTVHACQVSVALWCQQTEEEFERLLPFRTNE